MRRAVGAEGRETTCLSFANSARMHSSACMKKSVTKAILFGVVCLLLLIVGLKVYYHINCNRDTKRPVEIEMLAPNEFRVDGKCMHGPEVQCDLGMKMKLSGGDIPIHFHAAPQAEYSQFKMVVECGTPDIHIGAYGTTNVLPAWFMRLCPCDGPSGNVLWVFLASNSCSKIQHGRTGTRLDKETVGAEAFTKTFLLPSTNKAVDNVVLCCSSIATFGAIYQIVQQCGARGFKRVIFYGDYNARHMMDSETNNLPVSAIDSKASGI